MITGSSGETTRDAREGGATDTVRRIRAIVASASGNLVEWYDFYVYSFTALYFAGQFFPGEDPTGQLPQPPPPPPPSPASSSRARTRPASSSTPPACSPPAS